ncbi:MAG: hypothetical protein A3F17_01545 [Gammaproteobacteria bacterium RIFCSPHIGHO2_12_FULL_41_15]|nr:MAG: hypothetical protein A3F17_01545 [Gammaproteobacteria bacterium RIFCSPHIGHO2_12_FULL_41_15]
MHTLKTLYQSEKKFLQKELKLFEKNNVNAAVKLQIQGGVAHDPLMTQLLEAFALMSARLQYKNYKDNHFIYEALLQLLYPHCLLPMPAMTIAQYKVLPTLEPGTCLPRHGKLSLSSSDPVDFQSCYDVIAYPIAIKHCQWKTRFSPPPVLPALKAQSVLEINIDNLQRQTPLAEQKINYLELFLNLEEAVGSELYELFFLHCVAITLTSDNNVAHLCSLPLDIMTTVGQEERHSLLQYDQNSSKAQIRLMEYLAYPQKHYFIRLNHLEQFIHQDSAESMQLHFYFSESAAHFVDFIDSHVIKLFCTPIVNLVAVKSDPITIDDTLPEYPLTTSTQKNLKIFRVTDVNAYHAYSRAPITTRPYFAQKYSDHQQAHLLHWFVKKMHDEKSQTESAYLVLSSLETSLADDVVLTANMLVMQDFAAERLINAGNTLQLSAVQSDGIDQVKVLRPMRTMQQGSASIDRQQQLLHLLMHSESIFSANHSLSRLQDLIRLLQIGENPADYSNAILAFDIQNKTMRHPNQLRFGLVVGFAVNLVLDEAAFPGRHYLLFADAIRHYLLGIMPFNSFIEMTLLTKQRGMLKHWQASIGESSRE